MDILSTEGEKRTMATRKKHMMRSRYSHKRKEAEKQKGFQIISSHNKSMNK
jgi:hypothetical protein